MADIYGGDSKAGRHYPNVNKWNVFVIGSQFCFSVLSQSTMVVLQALSEYLINKPPPADLSLDVDVKIAGRKDIRYHFNPETAYAARTSRVRRETEIQSLSENIHVLFLINLRL